MTLLLDEMIKSDLKTTSRQIFSAPGKNLKKMHGENIRASFEAVSSYLKALKSIHHGQKNTM